MSLLEGVALASSVAGIYVLVRQPASGRAIRIGSVAVPTTATAGAILTAVGLLLLVLVGSWPAAWWSWEHSLLSAGERPAKAPPPGPFDLLGNAPGFWMASLVAVASAVVVVTGRASALQISISVFVLASAIVLGIASDWLGASCLLTIGLSVAWSILNPRSRPDSSTCGGNQQQSPDIEFPRPKSQAAYHEPLLATAICVLLAWGLLRGLHVAATFEAGPELAASGTDPALPRAARAEDGTVPDRFTPPSNTDSQNESWLLGLSFAVILATGVLGFFRSSKSTSPGVGAHGRSAENGPADNESSGGIADGDTAS